MPTAPVTGRWVAVCAAMTAVFSRRVAAAAPHRA
ncbi:hypothetical protein RKD49_003857 [Streptomyces glaucescens]